MEPFVYQGTPSRVVFAWGALARLPEEVERLGARRALILSTPEQRALAEQVAQVLGRSAAGVHAEAVMHVPVEVARDARDAAAALGADCCVAV
ncbi:MAG TPA: iron-containing alcohol dehydrogenase, partial [Burkholderia sp.]|nr:iron-containing alcohol dehydrogenase [Burkholderia sp.]